MPIEIKFEKDDLVVVRVSGMLGKAELDREQTKSEEMIRQSGHAKFLSSRRVFPDGRATRGGMICRSRRIMTNT